MSVSLSGLAFPGRARLGLLCAARGVPTSLAGRGETEAHCFAGPEVRPL